MKTILTILFLLLSAVVFSIDSKTQEYLLENYKTPYNLTYGIKQPTAFVKFNDFSKLYKTNTNFLNTYSANTEELLPFSYNDSKTWYKTDFAADPFDGRIEVLVMGEPLPSINLTLLLACIVSIAVLQYRKRIEIRKNTY